MVKKKATPVCISSVTPHEECEKCRWWVRKAAGEKLVEEFSHCWGFAIYDVDAARLLTSDGREVHDVPIERLAHFVDYPNDGNLNMMKIHVDEGHIDHVNLDEPVILAYGLKLRADEKGERHLQPIDGTHRIAKAIKLGHTGVKCVILSEEETDKILRDRRPPQRKPKATGPKIVKGTIMLDGVKYKAFENHASRKWYIVKGERANDELIAKEINAKSGKKAIEAWLASKE